MKRLPVLTQVSRIRGISRLMMVGVLFSGLLGGCVKEDESVIALGMPQMEKDGKSLKCEAKPGGNSYYQLVELDLSFNGGLVLPVELQSNLVKVNPQSVNSGVDNSEMRMRSVDVKISVPQVPAIEEAVRAMNPNYLEFNLPLASNSISGGGSKEAAFVMIPADTMAKFRDAFVANGFVNGAQVMLQVEARFHFDLTGGQGRIVSRTFRAPVAASLGGLRKCLPTSWKDPAGGDSAKVYELCSDANCASPNPTPNAVCGNAQIVTQHPLCCDGPDNWKAIPNAPEVCKIPR